MRYAAFKYVLYCILVTGTFSVYAQERAEDSLVKILQSSKDQAEKLTVLANLCSRYASKHLSGYIKLAEAEAVGIKDKEKHAGILWQLQNKIARFYFTYKNDAERSIAWHEKNKALAEENKLSSELINSCRELGKLFEGRNQFGESEREYNRAISEAGKLKQEDLRIQIECDKIITLKNLSGFSQSLRKLEAILDEVKRSGNKNAEFGVHHSFVTFYNDIDSSERIIGHHAESEQEIALALNNKDYLSTAYFDLGLSCADKKEGVEYFKKSFISPINRRAPTYNNIAMMYISLGDYQMAKAYIDTALILGVQYQQIIPMGASNYYLSEIAYKMGDYGECVKFALRGLELWKQANHLTRQHLCAQTLSRAYLKLGNFQKAYDYLEFTYRLKDSFAAQVNVKDLAFMEGKIEFQRIKLRDSLEAAGKERLQQARLAEQEAINRQQRQQRNFLMIGLALVLILVVIVYRSNQQKKKANELITAKKEELEEQKVIIENKQNEILDSIHYARRIQQALIPNEKYIAKNLDKLNGNKDQENTV